MGTLVKAARVADLLAETRDRLWTPRAGIHDSLGLTGTGPDHDSITKLRKHSAKPERNYRRRVIGSNPVRDAKQSINR